MPAVSTKRISPSGVLTTVSMLSRVVPGRSWTTDRSSPISRLKRVDLPTLGRPTMATAGVPSSSDSAGSAGSSGKRATTVSKRSPVPRPWMALTMNGSPRPSRENCQASASRLSPSTLLATTTAPPAGPAQQGGHLGVVVGDPDRAVQHEQDDVGFADGPLRLPGHLAVQGVPTGQPASGVDDREIPAGPFGVEHLPVAGDPGSFLDDGLVRPTIRFTSVDFPTFGRPTTATRGFNSVQPAAGPVGRDDLDREGKVLGAGAIEEQAG